MAIQILPAQENLGERLGTGLAQGLNTGLQMLAQQKLNQLMQRQSSQGLEALGFAPEQASALSLLSPGIQQEIVKQKLQAPGKALYAQTLAQLLGGGEPMSQEPQESSMPLSLGGGLNEKQATELVKLQLQNRAQSSKERADAFKQTKEERKEIITKARAARQNLHDLERMEELEREGKLDTPGYVEFLNRSGLDIPALMNPGSEEFNKIAANFMRDAKTYLGSRISNYELEQFLKTIPSLSQSPEGRKRVISNLKYFNRLALEYNNALKDVIEQNKGVPPLDLLEKVEDKVEKKIDTIAQKFKKDLTRPVPQAQNRLVTAAQAGLGSIIGAPGKIISGIGSLLSK